MSSRFISSVMCRHRYLIVYCMDCEASTEAYAHNIEKKVKSYDDSNSSFSSSVSDMVILPILSNGLATQKRVSGIMGPT